MRYFALVSVALLTSSASQGETVRYAYDAQGRLQVSDSRRPGGAAAGYGFDQAGNRVRYQSALVVRTGTLPSGTSLKVGEDISPPGGSYRFTLQFDGTLVFYAGPTQPLWATMSFQPQNAHLEMQGDGNLVLYTGNQPIWSSNTYNHPGAFFAVQDDGNIVVYDANGSPLWARF